MIIDTFNEYRDFYHHIKDNHDFLTVDVETTGVDPRTDRIISVIIKPGNEGSVYLPFRHDVGTNLALSVLPSLSHILSCPDKTYLGHNYKFDMQMLAADGIGLPVFTEDTMLAAHLMNENERVTLTAEQKARYVEQGWEKPGFGLKYLAGKYVRPDANKESSLLVDKICVLTGDKNKNRAKGQMKLLPPEEVAPYGCSDTDLTYELRNFYKPHLEIWGLWQVYLEVCRYQLLVTKMEMRGVKLDVPLIHQYIKEAEESITPALAKIHQLAGYALNPNSHKQLQASMGVHTTAAEHLETLLEENSTPHVLKNYIQALFDYRGWSKVNNTYYRPFLEKMDEQEVLHPNYGLTGTISGRLTCYEPNLQAIPRYTSVYKVKDVIVAREGYTLVSADYSQAELRVAAHYMDEFAEATVIANQALLAKAEKEFDKAGQIRALKQIEKYSRPYEDSLTYILMQGLSQHSITQKDVFGTEDKNHSDYDAAKRLNFSVVYGIGAPTLSERLRLPLQKARDILTRYHERFPGYKLLYDSLDKMAQRDAHIKMFTGRARHYGPGIYTHKASSNLIQGTVAEILRIALCKVDDYITPLDGHLLLQVYDQGLMEIPTHIVEEVIVDVKSILEDFNQFTVPMKVDIKYGPTWGNMVEWIHT